VTDLLPGAPEAGSEAPVIEHALTARRVAIVLAAGAAIGLSIFGVLVYRAVTIVQADRGEAARRFAAVRAVLPAGPPVLAIDHAGNVVRRETPRGTTPPAIRRLRVLVYYAEAQRFVSADVPFWFFRIKGPAVQYALRDTGLDLDRLGVTPDELQRHGPAVVIDHVRPNGDLLLVWTE
jgi:hypothetical protein